MAHNTDFSFPLLNLTYGRFLTRPPRGEAFGKLSAAMKLPDTLRRRGEIFFFLSTGPAAVIWLRAQRRERGAMKTEMAFTRGRDRRLPQD